MKKLISLAWLLAGLSASAIEYIAPGSTGGGGVVSNKLATVLLGTTYTNIPNYYANVALSVSFGGVTLSKVDFQADNNLDGIFEVTNSFQGNNVNTQTNTVSGWVAPGGAYRIVVATCCAYDIPGSQAQLIYFTTNSASGGGSFSGQATSLDTALTNYVTTSATNAARTISGVVNIKAPPYNATGDGTTDDSLAFYYARTNAAIYIPAGTYITTNVFFSNSIAIYGDGSATTIKFKSNIYGSGDEVDGNYLFYSRYGSINLRALIFDGQSTTNYAIARTGYTNRDPIADSLYRGGVLLGTDTNRTPTVMDCEFRNFDGAGVYIRGEENSMSAVNGRAVVQNCTFTNCYSGIRTGSGGTADYTRIIGNVFNRNYHALNIKGANVTISANQGTANYISFYGNPSEGRWHNTIVGNTFNHSVLAAFFLEGCASSALIADNNFSGGADMYFLNGSGSGSTNHIFRGNRFNACTITNAPGIAGMGSNYFQLNDFSSGAPTVLGWQQVFWRNVTPTNSCWPDETSRVSTNYLPWKLVQWGSTSPSPLNSDVTSTTTSQYGWFQAATSSPYCVIPIQSDTTNVVMSYYAETTHSGANGVYWTDTARMYYVSPIGGAVIWATSNSLPVQTYNKAGTALQTLVTETFVFPATNCFKFIWLNPQASTNNQSRFWVNTIKLVETKP